VIILGGHEILLVGLHGLRSSDIESLTCGSHIVWVLHVSDSMSPRMSRGNVTESASGLHHWRAATSNATMFIYMVRKGILDQRGIF